MGAEPGGAPLRPKAPLWVDRWLRGRVAKRSPKQLTRRGLTARGVRSDFHTNLTGEFRVQTI